MRKIPIILQTTLIIQLTNLLQPLSFQPRKISGQSFITDTAPETLIPKMALLWNRNILLEATPMPPWFWPKPLKKILSKIFAPPLFIQPMLNCVRQVLILGKFFGFFLILTLETPTIFHQGNSLIILFLKPTALN